MKLKEIPLNKIIENPYQPREAFDEEEIKELTKSIEVHGLLQPIVVTEKNGQYQVIAGERRWWAFHDLKRETIPANVLGELEDIELVEKTFIENWHRKDLTSVEMENIIFRMKEKGGYSDRDLGKRLGISHTQVGRYIRGKKDRELLELRGSTSTKDLDQTRGLDVETRKWVLDKMEKGEIPKGNSADPIVQALKKAPVSIRKAVIKGKIDVEDIGTIVNVEFPKEKEKEMLERLVQRKKDKAKDKDKGKDKKTKADLKRVQGYIDIHEKIHWWSLIGINMIEDKSLQVKAVGYIERIGDHCAELVEQYKSKI